MVEEKVQQKKASEKFLFSIIGTERKVKEYRGRTKEISEIAWIAKKTKKERV